MKYFTEILTECEENYYPNEEHALADSNRNINYSTPTMYIIGDFKILKGL